MGAEFSPVPSRQLSLRSEPGGAAAQSPPKLLPVAGGSGTVVSLGELVMILELHRQGLKAAPIARQLGRARETAPKYVARGLEPPAYRPRPPRARATDPFL